ncbi:MAG: FIG01073555: hypothetical protein [uncultured Solirubrobacteraceae bacterium]|uniref:DUF3179 domain-containing protein n=1 Tax=uncultured Solirubrobacteraceae bacterium TaxID=1162706 RepID=A0A6J4SGB4_9ACTN|nr:MAG: FIG01073555: hypothetical protein [uncultured Solirubrobacteraceae bacterium]
MARRLRAQVPDLDCAPRRAKAARVSWPLLGLLVVIWVLAGCGTGPAGEERPGGDEASAGDDLRVSTAGWKTDFEKHSVPLSEFASGGPPRDGIPPLDDPKTVTIAAADRWLDDREPVLVTEVGGRVRAYPHQILIWHEIVNDVLGSRPIAVTYCPLCNSSLVFHRRVKGETLRFGTTGNLRNSDLVMWDRRTESWWQQLTGEAVVGELTGTRLEAVPSQTLSWADFKAAHPRSDVLSRQTGYDRDYGANPYEGYDARDAEPFLFDGKADARLPPMERVVAFKQDGGVVVPFSRLDRNPVAHVRVSGRPVVVLFKEGVVSALDAAAIQRSRDVGTAGAFDRRVDGRTLAFEALGGGRFRDRQTGSTWDITGRSLTGELAGATLRPIVHDQQFWFALAAFLPKARIAGRRGG